MLDFRVVIAACIAGVVILLGGIGLVASFKIAHEPVARPANRIVERPRIEPNGSRPVVIETPAVKPAPAREAVRAPEPAPAPAPAPVPVVVPAPAPAPVAPPVEARAPAPPAAIEITGTIAPRSAPIGPAPAIPAPAIPAAIAPAPSAADLPTTVPVEHPQATADLPPSRGTAKKTPRRPRPAAPAHGPTNPFSAIFGGFNQ